MTGTTNSPLLESSNAAYILLGQHHRFRPHQYLIRSGQCPLVFHILLEGWAARYKLLPDGRRQITAFYLTGDLCDPAWLSPGAVEQQVVAMSDLKTIALQIQDIHDTANHNADLRQALWDEARVALDMQAEWALNLGRKSARERLAHLFCEIAARLVNAPPAARARCEMPLTQSEIADFTGLTSVHVNRILKQMRRDGLIELRGHHLHIPDMKRLSNVALFSNGYLRLQRARIRDFIAR